MVIPRLGILFRPKARIQVAGLALGILEPWTWHLSYILPRERMSSKVVLRCSGEVPGWPDIKSWRMKLVVAGRLVVEG